MTTISIVTPSLNQGRFLWEALESVRMQRYPEVEHLVLDGGSTDETSALLQSLERQHEWSHVRWQQQPDSGQSEALNRGFAAASGEIVGWLNADDRYRPGCLGRVARAFADHPEVDIFYGDYTFIDEGGDLLKVRREIEFSRFVLRYHRVLYIPTTTTFFRRRIFDAGYRLRPNLHYAMDYEFFMRLDEAGYRIRRIPQVLADFRLHPASKSCSCTRAQLDERHAILQAHSAAAHGRLFPGLEPLVAFVLQAAAALRRWSEKMLRGHYLVQYLAAPRDEE